MAVIYRWSLQEVRLYNCVSHVQDAILWNSDLFQVKSQNSAIFANGHGGVVVETITRFVCLHLLRNLPFAQFSNWKIAVGKVYIWCLAWWSNPLISTARKISVYIRLLHWLLHITISIIASYCQNRPWTTGTCEWFLVRIIYFMPVYVASLWYCPVPSSQCVLSHVAYI